MFCIGLFYVLIMIYGLQEPSSYLSHSYVTVTSRSGADHFLGPLHHRSTILSALGSDHALTVLFLGTHEQLPSGSPILGVLWPPSRLTSEFLRNPKPVSSQKASC
ncbi:hypothetical protein ACFX2H_038912 [Malus domestica]